MGLISIVSWEDDVPRCSGSGVTKLFPRGHAPWNTFTGRHLPAHGGHCRDLESCRAGLGEMAQKQCSRPAYAHVSPSSGSRLGQEQRIHVAPIIHLGARLLLVWLLQVLGQVLGPRLRSRALVLRSGRKEVWGLGRVMVARALGVTGARPKPVYRAKMVQKLGLSNWLNPWRRKEEKRGRFKE